MSILFITGVSEDSRARVSPDQNGFPRIHLEPTASFWEKIDLEGVNSMPLLMYGPDAAQPKVNLPFKPRLLVNQLTDADCCSTALARCQTICDQLYDVPIINHPASITQTTREKVSDKLQGIAGLRVPKTIRCAPSSPRNVFEIIEQQDITLPVLMHTSGQHKTKNITLINGPEDIEKLNIYAFDSRDFYLTEFVDFKDESGIYHTQRVVIIDKKPYLRHLSFSDHWEVNSKSKEFMQANPQIANHLELAEKIEKERLPAVMEQLSEVTRRLNLDYFGIDCCISENGEILIFEANATMNILSSPEGALFSSRQAIVAQMLKDMILKRLA